MIHTSGKSFCHLIWPHLVNWTLTFAVIGIFTSFIFLLSYLVKAVSDYMDRFVFRATCRPTCQVNYRYSSFDFKLRCCLINRYKNIQSKPYKYQNLNFRWFTAAYPSFSVLSLDWYGLTKQQRLKVSFAYFNIIIDRFNLLSSQCWDSLNLFRTTALECRNPEHNTHAFDLNGAMSAYLLFFLLIIYVVDAFSKYKDRQLEIHATKIRISEAPRTIDEHKMTDLRRRNKAFHNFF